jgi:hypothetical protein
VGAFAERLYDILPEDVDFGNIYEIKMNGRMVEGRWWRWSQ